MGGKFELLGGFVVISEGHVLSENVLYPADKTVA
jgi:hypothetical protein